MNYVLGKALLSLPFPYIFQIVIPINNNNSKVTNIYK